MKTIKDFIGKWFLRDGDLMPEEITTQSLEKYSYSKEFLNKLSSKGLVFDSKDEALKYYKLIEQTIKEFTRVRKVMYENNMCGSDAKSMEELVNELKCDNLQLMADLRAAKSEIERLREVGNRQ